MKAEDVNKQASTIETKVLAKEEYVTVILRTKKLFGETLPYVIRSRTPAVVEIEV